MNTTQTARKRAVQAVPSIDSHPHPHELPSRPAGREGYRLANLMRLREEAAAEVDRLLAFLDATEGDVDLEQDDDEDAGSQCDDEGETSDTGIADLDGYMEQAPALFAHCDVRVIA